MIAEDRLVQELDNFRQQFKYKYVGGGYFRDHTVPKGISADMLHGDDVISKFCDDSITYFSEASSHE